MTDSDFGFNEQPVEVKGLTRKFRKKTALDNVDLSVSCGRVLGLVGENGAGKTTLIKHLMGLLKAQQGSVRVFRIDPVKDPVGALSRIGYLSEDRDISLMKIFFGEIVESWMWKAIIIGVPAIVALSFYIARRRNLISTISLLYSLFLFPVTVISLWAFPWWFTTAETLKKGLPSLNTGQILIVIGTATLPFLPVALTPLIMDKLRHR